MKSLKTFNYSEWLNEQKEKGAILTEASDVSLTTWYAEQLVDGNILASNKNVLAAKRHLNDLTRQGTEEFPWVFDEERAHRPIRFIEKFCRPSKGNFNQLVFQPWQHFTIGSLYGWIHKDTGIRRFREGLIFVGRKNGKSTKISGVSLFSFSKDGENGADVYLLANTKQQAGIVYEEAKEMVRKSPRLRRQFRAKRDEIWYARTSSKIEHRASDSEKLDGLNTHLGVFDEIHEFKDYKLINVIKNSRGSRTQPLIIYITTAGYQLDGPLVDYYKDADDALNEIIDDERTFYYIAELDSEKEFDKPEAWIKANPNIGVSLNLETMVEDWEKAKRNPGERTDFITKQFNTFVRADEQSFIDVNTLKKNNKEVDLKDLKGKQCIGGFDLSDTEDFTSACLEFPLDDGEIFVLSHSWVPEAKVNEGNENIPYREYERLGLLTIIPGEYVRKEYVYDWFVEQAEKYAIKLITYDPAKAYGLVKSLESYGFETKVVRQGALTLGPTVDNAKELFMDGKVVFNNNRMFRWYVNNVKIKPDRNRNNLPQKQGRYRKIDGFSAFLNAHTEVMGMLIEPEGEGNIEFVSVDDLMGN